MKPPSTSTPLRFLLLLGVTVASLGCASAVTDEQRQRSLAEYRLAVAQQNENNTAAALVSLERSLRTDPNNAESLLFLGQLYGASGEYTRAEQYLRRAVEVLTGQAAEDPERTEHLLEARNSLAAALTNTGHAQEAVTQLQQVVGDMHYRPQHLAQGNLGRAYLALRRFPEAQAAFDRAVSLQPNDCNDRYHLGLALLRMNEQGRALEAFDRALATTAQGCAQLQGAWRARGELRIQLHQAEPAREDLRRCRELAPNTEDGRACAALLRTEGTPP